jgi:hypothetical protein
MLYHSNYDKLFLVSYEIVQLLFLPSQDKKTVSVSLFRFVYIPVFSYTAVAPGW